MNYDNALNYSSQWLDVIEQENFPEEKQAEWIIDESKNNFAEHFNRNWLEYHKSVTGKGLLIGQHFNSPEQM